MVRRNQRQAINPEIPKATAPGQGSNQTSTRGHSTAVSNDVITIIITIGVSLGDDDDDDD